MRCKLILCFVLLYWIGESGCVWADNWESINVSGYNHDVVVSQSVTDDTDATFVDSNGSGAWFAFYSSLYASENGKDVNYAFPSNKTIVVSGGGRYTTKSHDENNVLQISSSFDLPQSGTLTLASPKAYSQIGVLCTGGNGATSFSVVINYTDGTSSSGTSVTASDWCVGGTYAALFKRIKIHENSSGATIYTGTTDKYAYMYEKTVSADATKAIESITFSTTASGKIANIFAVSGYTGLPVSTVNVSYRDDAGTTQTVDAVPLTGSETSLSDGWYIVNSDITFNQTLTVSGNVNIIIADGCTMSVGTSDSAVSGNGIETSGTLKIYKQSEKTGKLEIFSSETPIATSGSGSVIEYDPPLSGTCGTNATWIVEDTDGDGIYDKLTITGTGTIENFSSADDQPWMSFANTINTIVIGEGITSVGDYSFSGFSALANISLPSTIRYLYKYAFLDCTSLSTIELKETLYIGYHTFAGCTSLQSIELEKVTSVGGRAFYNCTSLRTVGKFRATYLNDLTFQGCSSLESMTLPEGITNLPSGFFAGCTNLSNVTLPSTLKTINLYNVFQGCSSLVTITLPKDLQFSKSVFMWFSNCDNLRSIFVDSENSNYTSVDGVLYDKAETTLIFHPVGKTTLSGEIPSSVTTIESSAFYNSKIQSATLPEGIKIVKSNAFMRATLLEKINLPRTLTSIGDYAFHSCDRLKSVIIPSSVTTLGSGIFTWSQAMEEVYLARTTDITTIGELSFQSNPTYYVPSSLIEDYKAAENWSGASKIKALAGITKNSSTNGSVDYTVSSGGEITLEGTTYVKEGATITVTATPSSGLVLSTLVVKDANNADVATSGSGNIRTFTMPSSSVIITPTFAELTDEAYAVLGTDNKTLTFYYDNLKDTRTGTVFTSAQFPTTYKDSWLPNAATITTVTFDNSFANYTGVTRTACWFYKFENLTAINGIANLNTQNVTNMSQMFYNCKKLATLDVTHFNTSQVQYFGGMFENCESLVALDLSHFDTSNALYMSDMFNNCRELTTLDLSSFNTSKVIGMSAMFYLCDKLTGITFGSHFDTSNVEYMNSLFAYCYKLGTIDLSGFNTSKVMGMNSMFNDCIALTNLDISSFDTRKVTDMGYMFSGCSLLETLTFGDCFNTAAVTNMGYMFANCGKIKAIDLSKFNTEKVTNMTWMFHNCYKLASLDLSTFKTTKVTNMSRMFASNDALTSLDISNFNTSLVTTMEEMFSGSYRLSSLTIGSDFTIAGTITISNMFWNCTALASGTLTVKGTTAPSIGQDIFSNVFTDGTLTVDGGVIMDVLAVGSADEGSYTYTTWKGGRFNKTFFRDFAFTASDWRTWYGGEDLTANTSELDTYIVTDVTDSSVTLRETNGEIYQNMPMLLKRKDNSLTSVRGFAVALTPPTDASPYYIGGVSNLAGYNNVYVLVGSEFVRADLSGNVAFNPEKCFLTLGAAGTRKLNISIGGEGTTGIGTVDAELSENGLWYTLSGQKLDGKPTKKGMYIHNGRKEHVK